VIEGKAKDRWNGPDGGRTIREVKGKSDPSLRPPGLWDQKAALRGGGTGGLKANKRSLGAASRGRTLRSPSGRPGSSHRCALCAIGFFGRAG